MHTFNVELLIANWYRAGETRGEGGGGVGGHDPPLFFKVKKKLITIIVIC